MAYKELTVEDWFDEIDEGLRYRYQYGLEAKWAELEALFFNVHPAQKEAVPNLIAATGDALLSSLTVPRPYISVYPRRLDFVEGARIRESVDNMLVSDLQIDRQVEISVLHAFLWSRGFLKIGYDSEFGWNPTTDVGPALAGEPIGASMTQFDSKMRRIEFGGSRPGYPWVRSVPPHDIVVPWGTLDLDTAPWIAHRVVRHIDDIKADPKYSNKRDLRPVMSMEDFVKSYQSPLKPYRIGDILYSSPTGLDQQCSEYCELWEIHDRRTGNILVIASGYDKFLRKDPDALQLEGLPFVELGFIPKTRSIWTTSDAYYLRAHQAEIMDITIQSSKHRRISVLKWLYDESLISKSELERCLSSDVGVAVAIRNLTESGKSIHEAIMPLQAPPNLMLYQEAEKTRRDARETVGFSRNQFGEFEQSGRRTATEAAVVDRSSMQRLSRRHKAIKLCFRDIFVKINAIITEFWKAPRVAEILDQFGQRQWVQFNGDTIRGEYKYDVTLVDGDEMSLRSRRMNALQLYTIAAQDPSVDQVELRRYLVRQMNDPEFSRIFKPGVLDGSVQPELLAQNGNQQGASPDVAPNSQV